MAKVKERKEVSTDKAQAKKDVLAQLNKKYGKGTIANFSQMEDVEVQTIPTGSIGLDLALGRGGYPRGRVIELWGQEAAGKCQPGNTMVHTPKGILTIEEIFRESGVEPSCTTKITEMSIPLYNRYGQIENTTHFTNNGRRKIFKIISQTGAEIESTANHPHLSVSITGGLVWKKTQDIKPGDVLVRFRGITPERELNHISFNEAYLLGVLIADANFENQRVTVTNNDPYIKNLIETVLPSLIGTHYTKHGKKDCELNNSYGYHFCSKEMIPKFLQKWGFKPGVAKDKEFTKQIRSLSTKSLSWVIQGYLDCECSIDSDGGLEVTSASELLLKQLQIILMTYGIVSTRHSKLVKNYEHNDYYRIAIRGLDLVKYEENIGFSSQQRVDEIKHYLSSKDRRSHNINLVYNTGFLMEDLYGASETSRAHHFISQDWKTGGHAATFAGLEQALTSLSWADCPAKESLKILCNTDYFYDKVRSVEEGASVPTFDFTMSNTHSFISNSFITHNSSLALHAIAEVQKTGGNAAYIDAEQAMDPAYAKALGVNMDEIAFSQPSSGEQALTIVEELVKSNAFDIIIVDSVAALVPQSELDGEIGHSQMGSQARLMSQALRKLTPEVSKSKTVLFFINQVRQKIGVMYGPDTALPGGNALKFYASVRMEIRKGKAIKEGDEVLGNNTHIKIVKNKIAPPFKTADFDILYGKGINRLGELLDFSVTLGIIQKGGAWYSYEDKPIGQGREQAQEYLKENPEVLSIIEKAVYQQYNNKSTVVVVNDTPYDEDGVILDATVD